MNELPQAILGDLTLPMDAVHLWIARTDLELTDSLAKTYLGLMNDEEKERQERFIFPKHRHRFLIAHAFVRVVLSRYFPLSPEDWTFEKNQFGRPDVILPEKAPKLRFNLSHTNGLAVCALTLDKELGVDVEDLERSGATVELARRYFSESEVNDLKQLSRLRQRQRFFELWTLKESYMKARGIGLSLGLGNFSFTIEESSKISIAFHESIDDQPKAWQFQLFDPLPRYRVAFAVKRGAQKDLAVTTRICVPLLSDEIIVDDFRSSS
ncbi:MAG: 4'-phosphopantetheinyl transferase superfamily protein [Planctomycetota bacterium]|nr:4'-phosphopantetheinyl transferase superfamily protein [Planctomycetota bacterium]